MAGSSGVRQGRAAVAVQVCDRSGWCAVGNCGRGRLQRTAAGRAEMGRLCGKGEVQGAAREGLKGVIENEGGGGGDFLMVHLGS